MAILFIIGLAGATVTWLLGMRPLVVRHGREYRMGANLAVAAWVDWQSLGEIADEKNCKTARWLYRVFMSFQICFVLGFISFFVREGS